MFLLFVVVNVGTKKETFFLLPDCLLACLLADDDESGRGGARNIGSTDPEEEGGA